ncbi:sugar phosphate nucleotidyltransferase [Streptomyces sp. NPDC059989]|uniref:sugar phosphate nucleotidyltransferase n=1 Tax=Streptomyces sp. NPDC059989 TaxID=3347026 RepID=UPI0036B1946E
MLAAGRGERLRPVTDHLPKPLVPILNRPLLHRSVSWLGDAGVREVLVNVSHQAERFRQAAPRIAQETGVRIRLVQERRPSGPAGGLAACVPELRNVERCLVRHGDVVSDVPARDVLRTHARLGADLTVVATRVGDPWRFGVLDVDGEHVVGLREKPSDAAPGSLVSCGIYVVEAHVLEELQSEGREDYDFKDVVAELLGRGARVAVHVTTGSWRDIGDVDSLLRANLEALVDDSRLAEVVTGGPGGPGPGTWVQGEADIDPRSLLSGRVLLGAGARVDAGAKVSDSVLGPGCVVGAGATVIRSVLLAGAAVPAGSRCLGAVVL